MSGARKDGEPEPRAVALRYDPAHRPSPEVVAKGRGDVARRILEAAREHGVPVREDKDLVQMLAACEIGEEIPLELYTVVAELLAHLYRLNGAAPA